MKITRRNAVLCLLWVVFVLSMPIYVFDGIKFAKRMELSRCKINNTLMFNSLHMPDYICDALIGAGWQYMLTVENGCGCYKRFKDE